MNPNKKYIDFCKWYIRTHPEEYTSPDYTNYNKQLIHQVLTDILQQRNITPRPESINTIASDIYLLLQPNERQPMDTETLHAQIDILLNIA